MDVRCFDVFHGGVDDGDVFSELDGIGSDLRHIGASQSDLVQSELDQLQRLFHGGRHLFGGFLQMGERLPDLSGRSLGFCAQRADLFCDDGKAPSGVPSSRGLDGGVQCEKVRLVRDIFDRSRFFLYHGKIVFEIVKGFLDLVGNLRHRVGGGDQSVQIGGAYLCVLAAGGSQRYHLFDHVRNMVDLFLDLGGHVVGGGGAVLQVGIVGFQLVQALHDDARAVRIFRRKLLYDGDPVHNGVAGLFYLLDRRHDAVQICPDAVGHSAVRFVEVLDGHDVADIAEDDAGKLQLVIFHIGSGIIAEDHMINSAFDNDQRIDDSADYHKLLVFIED